jgi:small nuclear ribonucleoprotein (snRNP)-like protein
LKGYDQLMNLVMDDVVEEFEGESSVWRGDELLECSGDIKMIGQRGKEIAKGIVADH